MTKYCSKCRVEKPLTEFNKCSSTIDKLNYKCKSCIKEDNIRFNTKNKDYQKIYSLTHKIQAKAYREKYKNKL